MEYVTKAQEGPVVLEFTIFHFWNKNMDIIGLCHVIKINQSSQSR